MAAALVTRYRAAMGRVPTPVVVVTTTALGHATPSAPTQTTALRHTTPSAPAPRTALRDATPTTTALGHATPTTTALEQATPTSILAAARAPQPHGVTVGSFTSISLEPPIVSFAVRPPSRTVDALRASGRFVAHVLSKDQVRHSIDFSTQRPDGTSQFRPGSYYVDADGLPVLLGSLVTLWGKVLAMHTVGDHQLFLGEVTDVDVGAPAPPLLYYARKYHSVGDEAFMASFEDTSLQAQLWTHEGHLRMAWNYLRTLPEAEAVQKIRDGIQHFNTRNAHLVRHPYNETVTLFFVHMIVRALRRWPSETDFYTWLAHEPALAQPSVVLEYYSRPLLHSDRARAQYVPMAVHTPRSFAIFAHPPHTYLTAGLRFVPPDLKPLPP